jgi:hypothetical protein
MKRTLLALGILAGALMIATAPAQVVYSFEEPDMHGFADDDDPKTGWRVIQSSTIGVTHRNYSMGFFWPDEVSGFRWLISDGDPAKLAYLRISKKLLMDVTADATVPWTNMIVSLNDDQIGWRQTGFPVGLPREPGTRTVLLDLESLPLPSPDYDGWFQINFGLNAGATHRLYFDNMRLYRTACEMVAMTFDTDLHGFAPDPDDTGITVTWNNGKMRIVSQGGFHWILNGTVPGLAAMVRRGDLVVMDVTVVSNVPWANMIVAINSGNPPVWGQASYVADITSGGSGFTRTLALDYRDATLPGSDTPDYCTLNLGINSGVPVTLEIDNIRIYRKAIAGDVNCDGCVDDADLLTVLFEFGSTAITPADVNGDGVVDDADLLEVLFNFGNGC